MRTRIILTILLLAMALGMASADIPRPKILPVDKVPFNWPPAREIGQADYFQVAKDGKAACAIVLPAKPDTVEQRCARTLQTYVKLVTGAELEIKNEPAEGPAIYIGNTRVGKSVPMDLPKIQYPSLTLPNLSGYMVRTVDPKTLVIRGMTPAATSFGVLRFLRDYIGVRRYWPSEPGGVGDVYTRRSTISVPKLLWYDWPYFTGRHVGYNPKAWELTPDMPLSTMMAWNRLYFPLSMMHNFFELIPVSEYGKTHPEYYPLISGKRLIPKNNTEWQPCVSNPEVVDLCARKIIEAFDRNPKLICHALAVNDGSGDCQCAKCRAMDAPGADLLTGELTDRYVKFMNAVAEKVAAKYPDKLIGFLAYASVRFAPTTVKLHPNLVPFYCAMARGLYDGWDEWIAAGARNLGHYGYHDDRWFTIPKINPHQEARRIRYMVGSGVARGYYKEFNPTYPLDGQAAMIVSEMMWDPRLDENKLLDEYYTDMFSEAAPEMRAFYETLEADYEGWLKRTSPEHPYGPDRSDLDLDHDYRQFEVLSDAGADKAWGQLLKAEAKATDPMVKKRVALVKALFSFVRPCTHEYWRLQALPTAKNAADAEKWAREELRLAREKAVIKEKVMESPEIKPWWMVYRDPYDEIKVGVIPQQVYEAIDRGFRRAYQANPTDPAWQRLAKDSDPVIASSAQAVLVAAGENLVDDPGFEGGALPTLQNNVPQEGAIAITDEQPHSGSKCAVVTLCKNSAVVKRIAAKPGEKFWGSAWLRVTDEIGLHDVPAYYSVGFVAKQKAMIRGKEGEKVLDSIAAPMTRSPGSKGQAGIVRPSDKWQQIIVPFTAPAGTETVEFQITAVRQNAKVRLWVDDLSVTRAPIAPLALNSVGGEKRGETVYEE